VLGAGNDGGEAYRPAIVAGRYRVESVVRETETRDVVFAIDRREDREVVLKRLKSPSRDHTTRLRTVNRALGGLRHPSLTTVVDLIEGKRDAWLVSESAPGPSLIEYWSCIPLEDTAPFEDLWEFARPILASLFDGLEALHRAQIAHLDLKPTNVRMDPSGRAVLVDIGIAAGLDADGGEVGYLAPELLDGLYVSRLADQWSLGAIIYRLLAGRPAIVGGTLAGLEAAYDKGEVTPIREYRPDTPRKVEDIVLKMLAWEPDARFESISAAWAAFGERLGKAPQTPVAPWAIGKPPLVGREGLIGLFRRQLLGFRHGKSAVITLEDDIGRGKTRMLEAWAELARAEAGAVVHERACLPGAPRAVLTQWFRPRPGAVSKTMEELVQGVLDSFVGPTVLLLDDLEDLEDSTWQLLRTLAQLISEEKNPRPVLLVLSARELPEKGRMDPDAAHSYRVLLPPLADTDLEGLLRPGVEGAPDVTTMAGRLGDECRGRPDRLMDALLRAQQRGEIGRAGRRWVPTTTSGPDPDGHPPLSLSRLLGLLNEIGRAVPVGLLLQCTPLDRTEVVEVLAYAGQQRLVNFRYRGGRWWVESSTPASSDATPEHPATEFHARAAIWLERNYVDDSFAEAIGHHHRHSGRLAEAAEAFRLGAKAQVAVGEDGEAKRLMQLSRIYAARVGR
jgi:hypothetical protein